MSRLSRPRYQRRKTRGFTTRDVGDEIRRVVSRGQYRRELAAGVSTKFNGVTIDSYSYSYDALSRPTTRNSDAFGYNERGEVVFSRRDAENAEDAYSYDGIGNLQIAAFNFVTNTYTANNLNQYTSILRDSAPPREISHDTDGNMTSDGVFTYSYDSENRLASVSSNGIVLVANEYDYRGRRIRKTTSTTETTFVYDNWNLIHETVSTITGATTNITEIQYFWGVDLSGTLQGAGSVGGLLAVSLNGLFYFPAYDNNGNITKYIDESGNIVAAYEYDAFGRTISQSGPLADFLRHRFSTKYYDPEIGLYYYGYRFYSPTLMRWLSRDPIGVRGGINLYAFCRNNPIGLYDAYGCEVRISQENSVITVTLNITIYYANKIELNARTDLARIARRIKKQIEDNWNAQTWRYGCCTVRFVANVKYKNQVGSDGISDDNLIAITTDAKHRSYSVGKSRGYWTADNSPGSDWRYAHEAGHLMGLDDDYNKRTGTPNPGHEDHMMGKWGKPVAQHEVEDLLRANNVRCN